MAKRLSETEIWKEQWHRELPLEYKSLWKYLCDNCDLSGVWTKDIGLASFQIGKEIDEKKAIELFNKDKERIVILNSGDKWFIQQFVTFQYGILKDSSPIHKKVIDMLKKQNLFDRVLIGYMGKANTHKVKDKDKDKEEDKDKDKEEVKAKDIISDLNLVLGTSYKHTSKQTQDLIQARLNDGFTVDDFKVVHRKMLRSWGMDEKMVKYLRPITLYGNKFEGYLNMREPQTKLGEHGTKAYLIGQAWLAKQQEKDNVKQG